MFPIRIANDLTRFRTYVPNDLGRARLGKNVEFELQGRMVILRFCEDGPSRISRAELRAQSQREEFCYYTSTSTIHNAFVPFREHEIEIGAVDSNSFCFDVAPDHILPWPEEGFFLKRDHATLWPQLERREKSPGAVLPIRVPEAILPYLDWKVWEAACKAGRFTPDRITKFPMGKRRLTESERRGRELARAA